MPPWIKFTSIFCLGLLTGIAGTYIPLRNCMTPPTANRPDEMLDRLSSKLDLNQDQRLKVAELLKNELQKGEALHKETHQKFKVLRDSFDEQMKPFLTDEQRKKLDLMAAQWEGRQNPQMRFYSYRWSFRMGGHPTASSTVTAK